MFALRTLLVALLALGAVAGPMAGPIETRQIGDLACNVARLKTVGSLGKAGDAIKQLADNTTQAAAQQGLDQANGGIKAIAGALLSGQAAPAGGRDSVAAGLQAMNATLAAADP